MRAPMAHCTVAHRSLTQVPGGYEDSLSSNTELGRAVRAACSELDTLSQLEVETLTQADELLKKLGLKKSILQPPPAASGEE